MTDPAPATAPRFGSLGRVLHVDLSTERHWVEEVDEAVYKQFLGGYGLGAWLMWKHYPAGADPLAPEACFAICSGISSTATASGEMAFHGSAAGAELACQLHSHQAITATMATRSRTVKERRMAKPQRCTEQGLAPQPRTHAFRTSRCGRGREAHAS